MSELKKTARRQLYFTLFSVLGLLLIGTLLSERISKMSELREIALSPDTSAERARKSKEKQKLLVDILERNDLCAIYGTPGLSISEWSEALLSIAERDPSLKEAFQQPILKFLLSSNPTPLFKETHTLESSFVNALFLAGLYVLPKNHAFSADFYKSEEILRSLSQKDPKNAAIPYFLGQLGIKLSRKPSEIHAHFLEAFKRPSFDLHTGRAHADFFKIGLKNATTYRVAMEVFPHFPTPDTLAYSDEFKAYLEKAPRAVIEGSLKFGERLMKQSVSDRSKPAAATLYGVGRFLYVNAHLKLKRQPKGPIPLPLSELLKTDPNQSVGLTELLPPSTQNPKGCDPTLFQKYYDEMLQKRPQGESPYLWVTW